MASLSGLTFESVGSRTISMASDQDFSCGMSQQSFDSVAKGTRASAMSLRYKWVTHWEFIAFAMSLTFNLESMFVVRATTSDHYGNVFQFVALYVLFGLPAVYMQVVIGQYSQLGVTFMKYLIPIGHGLSYVLCVNTMVDTVVNGLTMGDIAMYLLSTMQKRLSWMRCPQGSERGCWGKGSNCTDECLGAGVQLSSQVFYQKIFMRDFDLDTTAPSVGKLILPKVVVIAVSWLIVFVIARTGITKYKKIVIMDCYVIGVLFVILLIVCCLTPGSISGIVAFFRINASSFFNVEAWFLTVFKIVNLLAIYKASYSVYGSYMAPTAPSDILTILFVAVHIFVTTFSSLLVHSALGIMAHKARTDVSKLFYLWKSNDVPYLTIVLQGIGFLGVPQLWSVIYLTICFLILLNNQVTELDVIERCITDLHSLLRQYRNYTIGALCLFGLGINLIFQSKYSYVLLKATILNVLPPIYPYEMAIFYTLVCWIYGVQKFSDDVHFLTLSQPIRFWKICWYLLPAVLWATCVQEGSHTDDKSHPVLTIVFSCIYIAPLPVVAVATMFSYLKQHNLPGLIQMQERWGSPDPQERRMRHLFNPREEIRSKRRNDECRHKCISANKALAQAIEQEDTNVGVRRASSVLVVSAVPAGRSDG